MNNSDAGSPPKVLWLTNVATPYRIPMWRWLNENVDLTLGLLRNPKANRFGDWDQDSVGVRTLFFQAPSLTFGLRFLYFPNLDLHKALMQDFDVCVLGGWETPAYFYALFVAKIRGIRVIGHAGSTTNSSNLSGKFISKLRGWFYRNLDFIVSYGTESTDFLLKMGVDDKRITTGFNSVDTSYFRQEVSKISRGSENSIGHRFIFVGRLIPLKNIPNIIAAFQRIKQPGDSLRIVGRGNMLEELIQFVQTRGLAGQVEFVEHLDQDDLIKEYAKADTLILASTTEVWGLVVNEALACGLNVVVSDKCGIASDIKNMDGVYISGTDVESISRNMLESRADWLGHRPDPEILCYPIENYGKHFIRAFNAVTAIE